MLFYKNKSTWVCLAIGAMVFSLSFCAGPVRESGIRLSWPQPPEQERIRYLGSFSSAADLNLTGPWLRKVYRFITGTKRVTIKLGTPYGIAVDTEGNISVADSFPPAIHFFSPAAKKSHELTKPADLQLVSPIGVAVDGRGNVFVSDSMLASVFIFDGSGKYRFSIDSTHFLRPTGIAVDRYRDRLYVVDTRAHDVKIFDLEGVLLKTIGGRGIGPGEFNYPTCICVDRNGDVYVGDSLNFRIVVFGPDGTYRTHFGQAGDGSGYFSKIKGVAVDSDGHIYVSDAQYDVVQVFDLQGEFLLSFGRTGRETGEFRFPAGLCIDGRDVIYVADRLNQRVQMFQYITDKNEH